MSLKEIKELDPAIQKLVFHNIAPIFQDLEKKHKNKILNLFAKLLELFPEEEEFAYKHFIEKGKFNFITVSPVKPSKKILGVLSIFFVAVIHYYLYNINQSKLCHNTFTEYKSLSQKQYDKFFTIKDSVDIHKQTIEQLKSKLVTQRSLIPVQKKDSSWLGIVPTYKYSGLTLSEIEDLKKRKKDIEKLENQKEDLQVIIEALGMESEEKIEKTLEEYRKKYDSDIEIYKENLKRCIKENSLDKLFLTVYYTVFMLANIYDSSIFQFIISLLPYSELFLRVKTDRIIVWTLSGIYMKYIGYNYLINDIGKYAFEKGYEAAVSGDLSNNFLTYIGIFVLGVYTIVKILDYLVFHEIPSLLLGSKTSPEKKEKVLKEAIKIKKEKRSDIKKMVGPKTPRHRIRKSNKTPITMNRQSFQKRKFNAELTGNYNKFWSDSD